MPEAEVAEQVQETPGSPEQSGKQGEEKQETLSAADVKAMRSENAALKKRAGELEKSERYWADKYAGADASAKPETEPDDVTDFSDLIGEVPSGDSDFIDDFTSNGEEALKKRGYITEKRAVELAEKVAERVADRVSGQKVDKAKKGIQEDAELVRRFPEIENEKSDFYKAMGTHYRAMIDRNPNRKNEPSALFDAAEKAELELKASGGDREEKRKQRIAAQAGGGGSGNTGYGDDNDGELTARQKSIADNLGVSHDDYKKQATAGVQVRGLGSGQYAAANGGLG